MIWRLLFFTVEACNFVSSLGHVVVDGLEKSVFARAVIDYLSFMNVYFHYISAIRSFFTFYRRNRVYLD